MAVEGFQLAQGGGQTGLPEASADCGEEPHPWVRGPPGLCAEVLWPPDLFFLGHQEAIIIIITQASQCQQAHAMRTTLHQVGMCADGEIEGLGGKRLNTRITGQLQWRSQGACPGAGQLRRARPSPLRQPGAGAEQLCGVPSRLEPPAATAPPPTCPPACPRHAWHPRALWKSDQPHAALQGDSWKTAFGRRVGWETELWPESRSSSGRAGRDQQPLLVVRPGAPCQASLG